MFSEANSRLLLFIFKLCRGFYTCCCWLGWHSLDTPNEQEKMYLKPNNRLFHNMWTQHADPTSKFHKDVQKHKLLCCWISNPLSLWAPSYACDTVIQSVKISSSKNSFFLINLFALLLLKCSYDDDLLFLTWIYSWSLIFMLLNERSCLLYVKGNLLPSASKS